MSSGIFGPSGPFDDPPGGPSDGPLPPHSPFGESPVDPDKNIDRDRMKKRMFRFALFFLGSLAVSFVVLGLVMYAYFAATLPRLISLSDYKPLGVTRVIATPALATGQANAHPSAATSAQDSVIGEFYKEYRFVIPEDQIPPVVVNAFISAEDDDFFQHEGISLLAIVRASIANFRAGAVVQGGSTITQQVAKSLFLTPERSFVRKIKEAILAGRIEKNLTKNQILFLYLNQIYLGQGAYGVQAASRMYFRKDVKDIALAEAALLAGMPRAPGRFSPLLNPKRAKERQLYVLKRMRENGFITDEQMIEAGAKPLRVYRPHDINKDVAPYYVEHLRRYLVQKYGETAVYEGGLSLYLPVDPRVLKSATRTLKEGLRAVDKRRGYRGPIRKIDLAAGREEFARKSREELILKKVPFELFMPDGRIGMLEAVEDAGISRDIDLLEADEIYEALVVEVNDRLKGARVQVGTVELDLPIENMKWARRASPEGKPVGPEPQLPSQVLSKGDIVLVRVMTRPAVAGKPISRMLDPFVAQLEQKPVVQGALYSIEIKTGHVLAMVGGYEFDDSEFNRAVQAQRQPGSAYKPLIYSAAIENGFTPASIIVDSPVVFKDGDLGAWKPENFTEKFYGDTTVHLAFIKSRNIPTIKLVQALGVPALIDYSRRLGMSGKLSEDLSISLGSSLVSLEELTQVYSVFPRLGRKITPIYFTKVIDSTGAVLEEVQPAPLPQGWETDRDPSEIPPSRPTGLAQAQSAPADSALPSADPSAAPPGASLGEGQKTAGAAVGQVSGVSPNEIGPSPAGSAAAPAEAVRRFPPPVDDPTQVLDPRVATVMSYLMKDVVLYGTGARALALGRPSAGKTGTTNDYRDAWFMGFTPQVATGVWVGFDDQTESLGPGETGAEAALPIWLEFMKEVMSRYPVKDFAVPPGVVFAPIDGETGKLVDPQTHKAARWEAFIEGTEPTERAPEKGQAVDTQSDFLKESYE